jgi:hypothetical protein
LVFGWRIGPLVDFLEELVVLADVLIFRCELECLLVGGASLVELALVFVPDREVIVGGRVRRIDLSRPLPAVNRFLPESAVGNLDAEGDEGASLASSVGQNGR